MKLDKGVKVVVGAKTYVDEIPDEVVKKAGIKLTKPKKDEGKKAK